MVERMQDLNLPAAVVGRLIKDSLPEGISASKEFRTAIGRAASVFVIFLSSAATDVAQEANVKTITAEHIFAALEEAEFESFVGPLKEALETYRRTVREKKESKQAPASGKKSRDNTPATSPSKKNGTDGSVASPTGSAASSEAASSTKDASEAEADE